MDLSFVAIVVQLIFLECILSIDNAAILGAIVAPLPDNKPIPWPRSLLGLSRPFDKLLGAQRTAALRVGLFGAYAGRGLMLLAASYIIQNPWLKLIGAAYLIKLAIDDLSAYGSGGEEETRAVKVRGFWETVLAANLMDLAFSLDNVITAVSLSDHLWVVMLGVGIGIVVMRFAAGIFSYIVEREPILKTAAYILVLNIGVELLLEDLAHLEITDWTRFGISVATILLALAYAHIPFLKIFRPVLLWISRGFAIINNLISWVLEPAGAIVHGMSNLFRKRPAQPAS